jgi:lipopolysaccharide assembly protein A
MYNHQMRILVWLLRLLVFILLLGFAIKNDALVSLHFFMGAVWQLPLVLLILLSFAGGALVGATALISTLVAQRREIARLRKLRPDAATMPKGARPQYPESI